MRVGVLNLRGNAMTHGKSLLVGFGLALFLFGHAGQWMVAQPYGQKVTGILGVAVVYYGVRSWLRKAPQTRIDVRV